MADILGRYSELEHEANDLVLERQSLKQRLARVEAAIAENDLKRSELVLEAEELALESRVG